MKNRSKRILIVDDEPMVTDFLVELVTMEGHNAVVAEIGVKAIDMLKNEEFHLILVDVNMPYVEGDSLHRRLKEARKDKIIPMIIISGSGLEPLLIQAIKKGVDTFMPKPSDIGLIRERINQCLSKFEEAFERKRILVVDDEAMVRDFMTELLSSEGYDVVATGDGQEALDRLRTEKFHLVIMDIDMAAIEGFSIQNRISKLMEKNPVPLIAMSGSGIEPFLITTLKRGLDNFIPKPLEVEIIRDKVKRSLSESAK